VLGCSISFDYFLGFPHRLCSQDYFFSKYVFEMLLKLLEAKLFAPVFG